MGNRTGTGWSVKSCGNAHAWCQGCMPEVVALTVYPRTSEIRAAMSKQKTQYHFDNPEIGAAFSERMIDHWEDPVNRLVALTNSRRYHDNDPDTGGAGIPGGLRDAHQRARAAYVAEEKG